jgi:hypothetical protein
VSPNNRMQVSWTGIKCMRAIHVLQHLFWVVTMKPKSVLLTYLAATAAAAEPIVPSEFLGTWAVTVSNCSQRTENTLHITESGVEYDGVRGHINAGATPGNKSIEVIFLTTAGRAKAKNVRVYRLTTDGLKLLEIRGEQVVATRVRCEKS